MHRRQTGDKQKVKVDRTLYRPVISTDVMGNRNVEVRAVEAWIQPAAVHTGQPNEIQESVVSAHLEETKMLALTKQKEEKLQYFKEQVEKRVKNLNIAHKKALQEKTCEMQKQCDKLLQISDRIKGPVYKDVHYNKVFNHHNIQTGKQNNGDNDGFDGCNSQPASPVELPHIETAMDARHKLSQRQFITWSNPPVSTENNQDCVPCEQQVTELTYIEDGDDDGIAHEKKSVKFDLKQCDRTDVKPCDKTMKQTTYRKVAEVRADEGQQQMHQAMCRRMFMNMEREQAKEYDQRQEHRLKIAKYRESKELKRMAEEQMSAQLTEPVDPITGESLREMAEREYEEEVIVTETVRMRTEKIRKLKELERFVEALKHRLKERAEKCGVHVPPLCCCSDSVWNCSPYTCANNCMFYQNPKEFSKALQSLLKSLQFGR